MAQDAPYVIAPIPPLSIVNGGYSSTLNLTPYFALDGVDGPIAHFQFDVADLWVTLAPSATPLTVANFRSYVTSGRYNGTFLHRAENNFIIQGGGYSFDGTSYHLVTPNAPVANESYYGNYAGTIAMTQADENDDSATSEWFFNVADNNFLDDGKFTVFGRLIGNGLTTAKQLAALQTINLNEIDPNTGLPRAGLPFETVPVYTQNAANYLVLLEKVEEIPLLKLANDVPGYLGMLVTSSNGSVFTPSISSSGLKLTSGVVGKSTITVKVTDPYGQTTSTSFLATSLPVSYSLQVSASPASKGTVTGGGSFAKGTTRTVKAVPKKGKSFKNWTLNNKVVSNKASFSFKLNSNTALVANFK